MAILQGPLFDLLPEIYPIIASHLPLHATSSTLLALASTNRDISKIVLPLVYSRLVLKNEDDAITVLQRLVDNPSLGRVSRELHIMSDLSVHTRRQDPPLDVIRLVADIISRGYLPFIHTLGLYLTNRWYYDSDNTFQAVKGFGQLRGEFWVKLKENCPRLHGLVLKGFADDPDEPWLEESGLLDVPDITSLTIEIEGLTFPKSGSDRLLRHISSLAYSLHTLELRPNSSESLPTSPIFELNLPCLRSLSLGLFTEVDTPQSVAFFERHPAIEYLDLASNFIGDNKRWFSPELPNNLLPNLRHLRAHWNDIRLLAPILNQLHSLSIDGSVNAQIPYLLRVVLPDGLPNLQSLDMGQAPSSSKKNKTIEGTLWYESPAGTFQIAKTRKESRTVFDSFMHSITVAAPNLEELGFHGSLFQLSNFISIAPDLNRFSNLRNLYYEEYYANFGNLTEADKKAFSSQARDVAEAVPGLMSITNVATSNLPYLSAKISRAESGEVIGVKVGKGYGMNIGHDDEAFPRQYYY